MLYLKLMGERFQSFRVRLAGPTAQRVLVTLAALASAVMLALLFMTVVDRNLSSWAKALLIALAVVVAIATILSARPDFDSKRPMQSLRSPPLMAGVFLAIFSGYNALVTVANQFSPGPAVEDRPGQIQDAVEETNFRLRQMVPDRGAAVDRVAGRWGETRDCTVAYNFTIAEQAITVEREAADLPPFRVTGTIKAETAETLTVTIQTPEAKRGMMLDLRLEDDGLTRRLVWDDLTTAVPLKLEACEAA